MAYTVQQVKADLEGILHGTILTDITNINSLLNRAARKVIAEIDPRETRRIANLSNPIHDDVYNYPAPSDLKKVIDIRPQTNRTVADNFRQRLAEEFDLQKAIEDDVFQVKHNDGSISLRISKDISPAPIVIHSMNSVTANGTWSAVGSATGVTTNTQFYIDGSTSIEFNLVSSGDGIQNTSMSTVDLTDHDEVGTLFVWVYFPSVTNVTSVTMLWGNDLTTNFWTGSAATAQHDGTAFRAGWNLIKFKWEDATESGTVAPATIDSIRITVAASAALNNIFVDRIFSSIGEIFEIEYYSQYLFRSSADAFKEMTDNDGDKLNLDTNSYNIYLYETAILAAQQIQGEDSVSDINFFTSELYGGGGKTGLYSKYRSHSPTEQQFPQMTYYRLR